MKKTTRFFLLMTSALVACVLGLNAYAHVIAGVPFLNLDLARTLSYLILCAFGTAVWRPGLSPALAKPLEGSGPGKGHLGSYPYYHLGLGSLAN